MLAPSADLLITIATPISGGSACHGAAGPGPDATARLRFLATKDTVPQDEGWPPRRRRYKLELRSRQR